MSMFVLCVEKKYIHCVINQLTGAPESSQDIYYKGSSNSIKIHLLASSFIGLSPKYDSLFFF